MHEQGKFQIIDSPFSPTLVTSEHELGPAEAKRNPTEGFQDQEEKGYKGRNRNNGWQESKLSTRLTIRIRITAQ